MIFKKAMSRVLLVLVGSIVIVGICAFVQAEINSWSTGFKTSEEVEETFDVRVENITRILKQHGLQSVRLSDVNEEDDRAYAVYLDDGASIRFGLYNEYPEPSYFSVSLFGADKDSAQDCILDLEQYSVFFEICQTLSNDTFYAERYRDLCSKVKKEADKAISQGKTTGLLGDAKLRTALFDIADVMYFINEDGERFYPEIYIFSNAY